MSPKNTLWILFLSLILGSSLAWAQSVREIKNPHEKTQERIQMIKMMKLTEALRLDREGAARFFAVDNQYEENKRRLHRDFNEDIQRLRNLMRDMNPPERELRDLVIRLQNRRKELDELSRKQMEEELNLLRPEQQARYFLFQIDFRREIENLIREIREERAPKPGLENIQKK